MGIVELAQIQLLAGTTINTPLLLENLRQVKKVIEDFNGLPTKFFVDQDDQSKLYVIGGWETVEQHSKGFSGSEEQNEILGLIKDQMTITWQLYVDVDCQKVIFKPSDWISILRYDIEDVNTGDIKASNLKIFETLDALEVVGWSQHAGGWALPGSMTAVTDLWVEISSFSEMEDAEDSIRRIGPFCKKFEDDHGAKIGSDMKVVRLLQL